MPEPRRCAEEGCELEALPRKQRCEEDWLNRQPPVMRLEAARRRAALVPEACRLERVSSTKWPEGRRWCSGCQTFVRLSDSPGSRCRACTSTAQHLGRLKNEFGIDPATYTHLFELQSGRCAICRGRPKSTRLAVDHDHKCCPPGTKPLCGRCTRGLLCSRCNHDLLGAAHDQVSILHNAVTYLERPPFGGDWSAPEAEAVEAREKWGSDVPPSF